MKQRFLPFFLNFMLFLVYLLPAFPIEETRIPGVPTAPPQSRQMVDINEAHGRPPVRTAWVDEVIDQIRLGCNRPDQIYMRLIPSVAFVTGSLIALAYYCGEYSTGVINIPALIATYSLAIAGVGSAGYVHCTTHWDS